MTAVREALVLPLLFLTVALAGGVRFDARIALLPPSLFALVLATMLIGTLVRSGALAPTRLLRDDRGTLANANGFVVLATLFAASAQVVSMLIPRSGLPMLSIGLFLFLLLLNTLVTMPDRVRLLRSLAVTLGSALLLKFVILAGLSTPGESRLARVLAAMFDVATLGTIAQVPEPPIAGYVAFFAVALFLAAVNLLPRPPSRVAVQMLHAGSEPAPRLPPAGVRHAGEDEG